MPSPEIANPVAIPFADTHTVTSQQVHSNKNSSKHYLKSVILLVAVYALIINRAADAKRTVQQTTPAPIEIVKPAPANAFVHNTTRKPQNTMVFTSGMPVIFYSQYILWK